MNFYNRYFSTLWGALSLISIAFWLVLKSQFSIDSWIDYSEGMLLLYLVYNSRALRSKQSLPIWLGMIALGLGMLFKFLHWPFAFQLLAFSSAVIVLAYTYFYASIAKKSSLDFLKLSWVYFFIMNHFLPLLNVNLPLPIKYLSPFLILIIYVWVSTLELRGYDQSKLPEAENELPEDVM
jgi:hypothetical protein